MSSSSVFKDGEVCYTRSATIFNISGRPQAELKFYSFGRQVARGGTVNGVTAVACGDGPFVPLTEPSSAECAPWRALMTPTPTCESSSPGVCP